jgi:UMF1 family MFS transporter
MNSTPDASTGSRHEVFAWSMYDWANSAYSTILITVMVSYIKDDLFPGKTGTLLYAWGIGLTMFVVAVCSPIFGAIADAHASKRRWLAGTALTGATASALMYFTTTDTKWLFAVLFLLSNFCFELSLCFYNGFLPEIADDENMGRISSWGYALGYVGGGLALAFVIAMLLYGSIVSNPAEDSSVPKFLVQPVRVMGESLGLPADVQSLKRLSLAFMGVWWGLFSLPTLLMLRDKREPSREPQPFTIAARRAVFEVRHTLKNVRTFRILALFLLGFLIYNDGVQTVISQSSVFAIEVLSMGAIELALVVLMIQFIALPGAILVGHLADRLGQKPMLLVCLSVWCVLLILAFFITKKWQFWAMAAVAALVLGGTQSVSRAIMGLMTPRKHTAEFFGFFNLSGKATSVFGPFFFGTILAATGSAHLAIVSLLIFFLVGTAIMLPLNIDRGRQQARSSEP